jgi:predicted amidohydrolase YtcJ
VTQHSTAADIVLVGGPVMTMDRGRPSARGVAVGGGRILAVGDERAVAELAGPHTRRIDLRGRTLLPGFIDAHCHPVMAGVDLLRCPLHELAPTLEAYVDAIRA